MQINRIIFLIGLILIQGCAPTSNDISKKSNLLKPIDKPKAVSYTHLTLPTKA